ncbi:uncharacterized protein LOC131674139 [Phymastichus coffea]|uniref:uncharacterized protein LOC131674139 n=1 Tax=Phymastichus coffea TaxID=108790 RepID=UPI00273B3B27|nr:uncharacterized protein LOC131674139 [Phymastichus coffea]
MEDINWTYLCMILSPSVFLLQEFKRSGIRLKDIFRYSNIFKTVPIIISGLILLKFINMTSTTNYTCMQVVMWIFAIARQTIFYRHKYSSYFKAIEIFLMVLSFISFCQVLAFSGMPHHPPKVRKVHAYMHPHVPGNFRRVGQSKDEL